MRNNHFIELRLKEYNITEDTVDKSPDTSAGYQRFYRWAEENGLNRETAGKLHNEDLTDMDTLALLTETDIEKLDLKMGQTKVLTKAISNIQSCKFDAEGILIMKLYKTNSQDSRPIKKHKPSLNPILKIDYNLL